MSEQKNQSLAIRDNVGKIISSLVVVLVLWGISWVCIYRFFDNWGDRGTFGDMFGAVNSLFSGLGLAGLIYTIWLQIKELQQQRKDIEETRKLIVEQGIENKFFQLLRVHHEIVNSIEITGIESYKGRTAFKHIIDKLNRLITDKAIKTQDVSQLITECLSAAEGQYGFGHYLKSLYNILVSIDKSDLDNETKEFYVDIIEAQLSAHEIILLFYKGLSQSGKDTFKPLLEKYQLLTSLEKDKLTSKEYCSYYNASAFESNKDSKVS